MGRLEGRVAVVTGAARGIGAATATLFAAEGAAVVLCDRDAAALEAVCADVRGLGGPVESVVGDCAAHDVAERAVAMARDELGGLDILINNAGSTWDDAFSEISDEQWDRVQHDIVVATTVMTRAFVSALRPLVIAELTNRDELDHHRKITNTASSAFLSGSPGATPMAVAAGAVVGLTRTLARELGSFAVNVNAVAPGFIQTRQTRPETTDDRQGIPEPVRQMTRAMTALGRWGTAEDVAKVHLFLASSDADFVSGVTIPVTGGLLGTTI